jgi:hypothetical protein
MHSLPGLSRSALSPLLSLSVTTPRCFRLK